MLLRARYQQLVKPKSTLPLLFDVYQEGWCEFFFSISSPKKRLLVILWSRYHELVKPKSTLSFFPVFIKRVDVSVLQPCTISRAAIIAESTATIWVTNEILGYCMFKQMRAIYCWFYCKTDDEQFLKPKCNASHEQFESYVFLWTICLLETMQCYSFSF